LKVSSPHAHKKKKKKKIRSGQVGSGRVGSGRVGSGRVGSGRVGSGQVRSGQVRSGQVRSGQVRSGQVRSGQVRSGQVRSGQVRSGQVRSGQVRSGQVRSGQVRSGQVPLQGAVRPCRWWRGLSNRSDARGDAGGSFALLAGSPMPARVERTGENKGRLNPQDPPRKSWHGNWRTRGRSELRLWSNADQPSYTVTAAHTSTTLASVAGVRRVRTRGRGACLNRPAREEATSIK
jgi:hypothetical protein